MSTDYAQQIIETAHSLIGPEISALLTISPEQNKARRTACKQHVLDEGVYPLKEGYENHISFALEAFENFDQKTQKEFMQAFKAIILLNQEIEMAETEGRIEDMRNIRDFEKILYPSTQLFLYEAETKMIIDEQVPKESLTHAAMFITKMPSLIEAFAQKYTHQLQALEADGRSIC